MLLPRIIPCLLIRKRGLVKTVGFKDAKYVGDPVNAVRIFNEKEVDELMVLDIDATAEGREPDYELIGQLAAECRMPLCYGGGVRDSTQVERIVGLGVEKVAMSTAAVEHPEIIVRAGEAVGSQSIVVVLDVRRSTAGTYEVFTRNGTRASGRSPVDLAIEVEKWGAGEVVVNSIDRDGAMKGYDLDLVRLVRRQIGVPMTCLGGAGSLQDIRQVISEHGAIGAAAGSLFVFKGIYRAVLINYPNRVAKDKLYEGLAI